MRVYQIPQKKKSIFSRMKVNTWLILINVILFIVFTALIGLNILGIEYIAINPANILMGKYLWTFITSMFMHSPNNIFHIFANMLSLFFVGSLAERIIGSKRYLWFYLAAGIFASLLFVLSGLLFTSELNAFAVGASGAIFGVIGLLMTVVPNLPVYIMFIPIPVKLKYAAPGMLIVLWLISIAGNVPIGNFAHLGGFLFGIFYGFYLKKNYKNKTRMISRHFS